MTAPTARKGRKTLSSSDVCPRRCGNGTHLVSDHVEEKARQCNLCSCVIQDVHATTATDPTLA